MAFDPGRRYADISALQRALKRTRKSRRILSLSGAVAVLIAAACVIGLLLYNQDSIRAKLAETAALREMASLGFQSEIIYQAARASAGLEDKARLTPDRLQEIEEIYIVGNECFATSKDFYDGIQSWYQTGRKEGAIRNLDDLSLMPKLKEVCIVGQQLSDISAVSGLAELEKIEIKHNSVSDISALSGLSKLGSVGINDNPVTELSPLASCPELKYLDLCDCNGYAGSVFEQLGDFVFLDISNQTSSYKHLSGKTISRLKIAWSKMDSLSYLDDVSGLEELEINNSKVTDLTPLLHHPELRVLNIKGLDLQALGVLMELPKLEQVIIGPGLSEEAEALGDCPFEIIVR